MVRAGSLWRRNSLSARGTRGKPRWPVTDPRPLGRGRLERAEGVTNIIAERLCPASEMLAHVDALLGRHPKLQPILESGWALALACDDRAGRSLSSGWWQVAQATPLPSGARPAASASHRRKWGEAK